MYKVESRTTKASPKIACDAMVCRFKATEEPAGLLGPARDGGCKTQKLANYLKLFNLLKPLWAPEPGQSDPGHSAAVYSFDLTWKPGPGGTRKANRRRVGQRRYLPVSVINIYIYTNKEICNHRSLCFVTTDG